MSGFRSGSARKIGQAMLEKLQKEQFEIESKGTQLIQNSVEELNVVDTRNLKSKTNVKTFSTSTAFVIRGQTVNVPYAIYPLLGLGTSRAYGERNWFYRWSNKMTAYLKRKYK